MGKYSEAIKAKLATLGKAKLGTVEDFTKDPQGQLKEVYLENDEFFIRQEISEKMAESLRALPEQKRNEINALNVPEEEKWTAIADAYEAQFGPEAADAAAKEVEGFVSPSDPRFPEDRRYFNPYKNDIDALRGEIKPDDPEAAEKRALLDRVNKELSLGSDEVLEHLDRLDDKIRPRVDSNYFVMTKDFIDGYQGGKYASKLPTAKADHIDLQKYTAEAVEPRNCSFTSDDSARLVGMIPEYLSPEMKKDVLDITGKMAEHSAEYDIPGSTVISGKSPSGKGYYFAEQGQKSYAFWPLHKAYENLGAAVKQKDLGKIREAEQKYRETRKFTDEMMETMGKYKTPLCGGNVNSTRSGPGRTGVPEEYMKDFVTHSKVNGLYMLHGFSKNTGLSVKELLDDPASAMRKSARNYLSKEGDKNMPSLGAKLVNCMSVEYANMVKRAYADTDGSLAGRAFEALSSMEKDPEKAKKIAGVGALAVASGTIIVNEYTDKIEKISEMDKERKDCFYQHAALLPDKEFEPTKLYDKLSKENWKETCDPKELVSILRSEGKLDFNALADRYDQVLEGVRTEMDRADAVGLTAFNTERFYDSSIKAYKEIIKTATPQEKKDPAFQKFFDKVTYELPVKYGKDADKLYQDFNNSVAFQQQKKSGWFLSSKNSPEHDKMVIAQRKLQYKLKQLRGEPIDDLPQDEIEALKKTDTKKLIDSARQHTYEYCRLKTNDGKDGFIHKAGVDRYNEAYKTLKTIDDIAENCGILPPGQRLMQETKNQLLDIRTDRQRARDLAEDAAAREILGMTLANGKKSFEEQERYTRDPKYTETITKIKTDPAFRRMMQNEGAEKMVDNIIAGKTLVTDAYIKAKNQVELEAARAGHEARQDGIKVYGNEDVPPAMGNEDKKKMWGDNPLQL